MPAPGGVTVNTVDKPPASRACEPFPGRAARTRESLLAALGALGEPTPTRRLEAQHGHQGPFVYAQLVALERAGAVRRYRVSSDRSVYWWPTDAIPSLCAHPGCSEPGYEFVPPVLTDSSIYDGQHRFVWRCITEHPGSGGWACADLQHITDLWITRRAHTKPLHDCALDDPMTGGGW